MDAVVGYEEARAGTKSMRVMVIGMIRDEPEGGRFMDANPTMKNVYLVHQMIGEQENALNDYLKMVRALEGLASPANKQLEDEDYE